LNTLFCRIEYLRDKLQEVEQLIIHDDAIAKVAQLSEALEEIEQSRSNLENLLDCAGLALGAAMQSIATSAEVRAVMQQQGRLLMINDDAIPEFKVSSGSNGEKEESRSNPKNILDCAGLALGALMQSTEMPAAVRAVMQQQGFLSGLHSLAQQLHKAYYKYSHASAVVSISVPKAPLRSRHYAGFGFSDHVVQHTQKHGLVDKVARTLPSNCTCFMCMVKWLVRSGHRSRTYVGLACSNAFEAVYVTAMQVLMQSFAHSTVLQMQSLCRRPLFIEGN
jgi:hypothetical protein